nr:hypothetical protein pM02_c2_08 [uncultured bacterium]
MPFFVIHCFGKVAYPPPLFLCIPFLPFLRARGPLEENSVFLGETELSQMGQIPSQKGQIPSQMGQIPSSIHI